MKKKHLKNKQNLLLHEHVYQSCSRAKYVNSVLSFEGWSNGRHRAAQEEALFCKLGSLISSEKCIPQIYVQEIMSAIFLCHLHF